MIKLCLLPPTYYIEYANLLPGRMAIASAAAKSVAYTEWFAKEVQRGKTVMLDQGVYEKDCVPIDIYLDIAARIRPTVLIVPDTIGSGLKKGYRNACAFADHVRDIYAWFSAYEHELMYVPQASEIDTLDDFKRHMVQIAQDGIFKWIALAFDTPKNLWRFHYPQDEEMLRFAFIQWMRGEGILDLPFKWHLFGVGDRVETLQHYSFAESADTASFFWQAAEYGATIKEGLLSSAHKRPVGYFERVYSRQEESVWKTLVEKNCRLADDYAHLGTFDRGTKKEV